MALASEENEWILHGVANGPVWFETIKEAAFTAAFCAACTIGVAGLNHVLCRKVPAYRRANAAMTTAIDYAPQTTLATTAAFGLYGVAFVALAARSHGASLTSPMGVVLITHWGVANLTMQIIAGRFIGHAVAAAWFGSDALNAKQKQSGDN